ncbi:hypothetical protein KGF54_000382 [Candida jiufengensis]|uniref:uncharacterized protein n=1 Tax=Candida jiufengensis TaxID=497108 RepID=UPI0022252031|nr:uncharacterized protein KGF54_000382 [Candida jiufengensis]KAI5956765.1 hypothetical protein KGF54_000382 [Candida jiufengensis]
MSRIPQSRNLGLHLHHSSIPLINLHHQQPKQIIPFPSQINPLQKPCKPNNTLKVIVQRSPRPTTYLNFKKSSPIKNVNDISPKDKLELQRKINISNLIETLKSQIPHILEHNLSKDIISNQIFLRICPSQFDENYLPKLQGHLTYYSTCKAITLFITSIILSPKVKIHISNIKVSTSQNPNCMFKNSTKIYIRWNTCLPNCSEHLGLNQSTIQANLGSRSWSNEDTKNLFVNNHNLNSNSNNLNITKLIGKITKTLLTGLKKDTTTTETTNGKELERVIYGLFIFELNEECDKILVHTIENMDIVEKFEFEEETGPVNGLRVC